ncbi:MAG: hypothetical protein JXA64_01855 [Candidatus Fermentibacteraceae bacterium]|nr:hypothetical protein [Candidatus Fermentibacteraceae bacterium]
MRISVPGTVILAVILAVLLRSWVFVSLDTILPQNGLYVDEKTFAMSPFVPGVRGFSRPPGMFAAFMLLGSADGAVLWRVMMSLFSILPALALYLAMGRRGPRTAALAAGLAVSPFLVLYGLQLMPAVPAAVLLSFALLASVRENHALAGFLTGTAVLFRAELAIVPAVLLLMSFGSRFRSWTLFTSMAAVAVLPVVLINVISGAGPVIAANGGENLWIGTSWEMISTPPGVEFEELVAIGPGDQAGDHVFFNRALRSIGDDPVEWAGMGIVKAAEYFSLPGPGRNMETGWVMGKTFLLVLLPLTLAAMSLGISGAFIRKPEYWVLLSVSILAAGIISSFVFFPSARFRTATLPAFWFLAAGAVTRPGALRRSLLPALTIILISALLTYPGKERSGLTSMLAAEHMFAIGDPRRSMEYIQEAADRGYDGADLHNVRGACLSSSGYLREGLTEFEKALQTAPSSPTVWKNYAVSLWSNGRYVESLDAARRAIYLNPLLREELGPILDHGEDRGLNDGT